MRHPELKVVVRWVLVLLACCSACVGRASDAVVAPDGSGDFTTVQAAIAAAPYRSSHDTPYVIVIKPGTYREKIYVQREKCFVRLVGEDPATTVLSWNLHAGVIGDDGKPIGTFRTPSVQIDADDFTCENLTLENTAGPVGQALALRIDGDRAVFRNCRFLGWQDTILVNRGRHYFEGCTIAGHVDFIFGGGIDWFERCEIVIRGDGYITAASTRRESEFGYVFARCRITGDNPAIRTYLGRPWRDFAATVFLDCWMGEVVRPAGWHNWDKPEREATVRYAEFRTTGPGTNPAQRAPWARQLTADEAAAITVQRVLGGADHWDPTVASARAAP